MKRTELLDSILPVAGRLALLILGACFPAVTLTIIFLLSPNHP